ncbi:MAG: hypothetical protein JO061_17955 [Acidobacteriaceae bacterium]|nr:hypothetical protein [Acidobacteriaceae bacterium]
MQTRRQLLRQALTAGVAIHTSQSRTARRFEILSESTALSQESARGFATVAAPHHAVIVVCGAGEKALTAAPHLFHCALQGAWLLWESALHDLQPFQFRQLQSTLRTVFDINIGMPFHPGLYIEYIWPKPAVTRSFLEAVAVECNPAEVIARHAATPVAMRRRIGRGGIVFLGSMLGPNLYAEEPEAYAIATNLLYSSRSRPPVL